MKIRHLPLGLLLLRCYLLYQIAECLNTALCDFAVPTNRPKIWYWTASGLMSTEHIFPCWVSLRSTRTPFESADLFRASSVLGFQKQTIQHPTYLPTYQPASHPSNQPASQPTSQPTSCRGARIHAHTVISAAVVSAFVPKAQILKLTKSSSSPTV